MGLVREEVGAYRYLAGTPRRLPTGALRGGGGWLRAGLNAGAPRRRDQARVVYPSFVP